jgi:hypothetical protein
MVIYGKEQIEQWDREDEESDRQLTTEQRITLALQLFEVGRKTRLAGLKLQYPNATPEELQSMFVRELEEDRRAEFFE